MKSKASRAKTTNKTARARTSKKDLVQPAKRPKAIAGGKNSKNKSWRRRYLPPVSGVLVFLLVFGFFNSPLLSSRIAYYLGKRVPAAELDAKTSASPVSPTASQIIINSIGVNAPVIFESQDNENTFLYDLRSGVVHYPNTAVPGQEGNVAIFGHSSGVWWEIGNYKFVFTLLDKVKPGDKVFIDYKGTRYIYRITDTETVSPTDVAVLNQTNNHMLTLITCTPVGTSTNRFIVHAVQYSPKPVDNPAQTPVAQPPSQGPLPGNDSSVLHNLREAL